MNKEILELIEPYMNKTLSKGCLVIISFADIHLNNNWWNHISEDSCRSDYIYEKLEWYWKDLYTSNLAWAEDLMKMWCDQCWWEIEEILWHYDISSVLKYIIQNDWEIEIEEDNLLVSYLVVWLWGSLWLSEYDAETYIPNKPLHLYTEEEQADLLRLLKTLK